MAESLSLAVAHAVAFLTARLAPRYAPAALRALRTHLEANLTAHYAPSWVPAEPLRGSGRRCITLSPDCLPPRPVWAACSAAAVQWFDWIAVLGGAEFDLFVDPGCVAARVGGQIVTVWAAPQPARKTFAQQVLEEDTEEEDTIFTLLADEISAPTWATPLLAHFPAPPRSTSPMSSVSDQSRCSSRSSNSAASAFSFSSADTASSRTSAASANSAPAPEVKQSRRERARQARVFVDTSKTEVTPYDGGKTTVLTGGVMLGGGKPARPRTQPAPPTAASAANWRASRA